MTTIGWVPSKETRVLWSLQRKGKRCGKDNPMFGRKGVLHPLFGTHCSEKTLNKMSAAKKGIPSKRKGIPSGRKGKYIGKNNPNYGNSRSPIIRQKISKTLLKNVLRGEKSPHWRGGQKLTTARDNQKRRKMGFMPITIKNPYTEPIVYHHIDSQLPFVVPCPTRIHLLFGGGLNKNNQQQHTKNVNAMLGIIRIDDINLNLSSHLEFEQDIQIKINR